MNKKQKQYQKFCGLLKDEYLGKLRGEGKENEYIYNQRPTEKLMIGILDSGIQNEESRRYTSMPMVKVQFFLNKEAKGLLKLSVTGNLFYNVIPTYDDEIRIRKEELDNIFRSDQQSDLDKEERETFDREKIYAKYKRIKLDEYLKDIEIQISSLYDGQTIDLTDEINNRISKMKLEEPVFYSSREINEKDVLLNEENYKKYIENHFGDSDSQIFKAVINWKFDCKIEISKVNEQLYSATLIFKNITEKPQDLTPSAEKQFEDLKYSIPLYNVGLKIVGTNGLVFEETELESFKESYKVNSKIQCKGEWISATCIDNVIYTDNVPTYIQHRLITKNEYNDYISFKSLQNDPIDNLKKILLGMKDYYQEIEKINSNDKEYFSDLEKFKREIRRFEKGIQILEDDDFIEIKKAFICMNKSFENPNYDSWRLFQIVFIVSMISDIVYNDNKDVLESEPYNHTDYNIVETIYFPTGGGKTEAFLGTAVLSMFYDRFIGKNYGVNTIIKYPLRLLSVQQLERTLEVIERANTVLKATEEIKNSEIFTLGYFVGSSNTPNEIKEAEIEKYEHESRYILIDKCSKCGKNNIDVIYDKESKTLRHVCKDCGHILPLYIVDDDIYRFLPTVLISTVDKLASVSFKDEFRNIMGGSNKRCKKHGFTCTKHCKCDINDNLENVYDIQRSSLAPTLFIQDEVHLLKESLGVFSSHYESFISYYISELLEPKYRKKTKNIGATATISGADDLIKELYSGKQCRIFPSPSTYSDGRNFYSEIDYEDISRYIIGFAPFGDSINARIEYAVSTYRLILFDMYNNPEKYNDIISSLEMTIDEFKEMIFYYWTTIVYFRSKNDNNKLRSTFEQQGNDGRLSNYEDAKYNIVRMTGDEDFSEIKESLNNMSIERDKRIANNLVLATSTISHGVDSKDFNNIFFYGIPSNTAEYIQSYSRVGRTYTGIVVDIIRLARNRDVSFLKYFNMMHQYKDYLIDENRINSKSVMAMYHTLPGLFLSLLKHYYSIRDNKKYDSLGDVYGFFYNEDSPNDQNVRDFVEKMCAVYGCKVKESDNNLKNFSDNLQNAIIQMIKNIKFGLEHTYTKNTPLKMIIDKMTINNNRVMSSLRDVDTTYNITLKIEGEKDEEK